MAPIRTIIRREEESTLVRRVRKGEYSYVAHGSQLDRSTLTFAPGEKLYFICNDEPGFYFDNKKHLTVKWGIV